MTWSRTAAGVLSIAGLLALAALTPLASASPRARAHAATLGNQVVINLYAGLCMEDKSKATSNGAAVDLWSCNGGRNQVWDMEYHVAPESWTLVNQYSGLCLDVYKKGTTNGTPLVQWPCDPLDAAQQFYPTDEGTVNGHQVYALISAANYKCVEDRGFGSSNGAGVDVWECNGGHNQLWWH